MPSHDRGAAKPRPSAGATALGLRAHSGWAVLLAVAGPAGAPEAVLRRRIELADPDDPHGRQPYHAAAGMSLGRAEPFIERRIEASRGRARAALRDAAADVARDGRTVRSAGLLLAAGRPLPGLEAILRSHSLIHAAEGEMFRDVLRRACHGRGLALVEVRERELRDRASAALELPPKSIERRLADWGQALGPPWRQDEKLAALAAWLALTAR